MKIEVINNEKKVQEIEIDPFFVGVMNHRDLTVDYVNRNQIIRFMLTDASFYGLIDHYKAEEKARAERKAQDAESAENTDNVEPEDNNVS